MKITHCKDCMFWNNVDDKFGECHRRAPTAMIIEHDDEADREVAWPFTTKMAFCGEGGEADG